jgi:hypothetical protein
MVALFCLGLVFLLAVAVTLYAVTSARFGYEDHLGFHYGTPELDKPGTTQVADRRSSTPALASLGSSVIS